MAVPADIDPATPHAFLSYTRFDDKFLTGGISALREALEQAVQARTGKPFNIFQDVDDIKPGDAWRKKLDRAIEAAQLFIPILTPSFFESDFCRGEAQAFLDYEARAGRDDLVLPIYLIDTPKLDDADQRAADDMASRLHERQYDDWRSFRYTLRHEETRPRIDELAGAIASAVARNGKATAAPPPLEPPPRADIEDRLGALEAKLDERDRAIVAERSRREGLEKELANEKAKNRELAEAPAVFKGQVEEDREGQKAFQDKLRQQLDEATLLWREKTAKFQHQLADAEAALEEERARRQKIERQVSGIPRSFYLGASVLALLVGAGGWMAGLGGPSSSDIDLLRRQNGELIEQLRTRTADLDEAQTAMAELKASATTAQADVDKVAELTERVEALSEQLATSEQAVDAKESELQEVRQALTQAQSAREEQVKATSDTAYEPLTTFKDCTECPQMVVIPAGAFFMGSHVSEPDSEANERPRHKVNLQSFAIGKYEVTFAEWDACVAAGACVHEPNDEGWGRGARPVIDVNWNDAQQYVAWLSGETGETYRLPSEAEWEFAARAFPTSKGPNPPNYAFGDSITTEEANFNGYIGKTTEAGMYPANEWGLHDMYGNVWEWVEDRWHDTYDNAPTDGRPWVEGDISSRVIRGGAWKDVPEFLRSAVRFSFEPDDRFSGLSFRVARTLTP